MNSGGSWPWELGADAVYDAVGISPKELGQMGEFDVSVDCMGDDLLPEEPSLPPSCAPQEKAALWSPYGHPRSGRRFSPMYSRPEGLP